MPLPKLVASKLELISQTWFKEVLLPKLVASNWFMYRIILPWLQCFKETGAHFPFWLAIDSKRIRNIPPSIISKLSIAEFIEHLQWIGNWASACRIEYCRIHLELSKIRWALQNSLSTCNELVIAKTNSTKLSTSEMERK